MRSDSLHFSSKSAEWNTPPEIIAAVVDVLGVIDIDPCSDSKTEPNVPAEQHYTIGDDGLSRDWHGRVYLNPPYGRDVGQWVNKLASSYRSGEVTEAIALLPARTDTKWFRGLREFPRCFVDGRLKFGGCENSAPFPSAIFYLGDRDQLFAKRFGQFGDIFAVIRQRELCAVCGDEFLPRRSTARYCGDACRQYAFRQRNVTLPSVLA